MLPHVCSYETTRCYGNKPMRDNGDNFLVVFVVASKTGMRSKRDFVSFTRPKRRG